MSMSNPVRDLLGIAVKLRLQSYVVEVLACVFVKSGGWQGVSILFCCFFLLTSLYSTYAVDNRTGSCAQ